MKTLLKRPPLRLDRAPGVAPALEVQVLQAGFERSRRRAVPFQKPQGWRGVRRKRGGVR